VEEQSLKFSIKVVNKTAASALPFAKYILLHAYLCTTAAPSCTSPYKNFILLILTSWHNIIFGYKLRNEAEYP